MKVVGLVVLLAVVIVAYVLHERQGAIPPGADESPYHLSLVSGRCTEPESVDRRLLQQTWFHDQQFTQLAGIFGQTSFTLYAPGEMIANTEGAYCIVGDTLHVRYYERVFVPVGADLSRLSVTFGARLNPMETDSFVVRDLTGHRLRLAFSSDGREHVFYRKN